MAGTELAVRIGVTDRTLGRDMEGGVNSTTASRPNAGTSCTVDTTRNHSSELRPRSLSRSRRSRLVGRPAPRSRRIFAATSSFGGGGGVRSMTHSAATTAPTRFATSRATRTVRSRSVFRSRTSSPMCTGWAALALSPFTCTCPARQAAVAAERVFESRTAQIQLSTRVLDGASIV